MLEHLTEDDLIAHIIRLEDFADLDDMYAFDELSDDADAELRALRSLLLDLLYVLHRSRRVPRSYNRMPRLALAQERAALSLARSA